MTHLTTEPPQCFARFSRTFLSLALLASPGLCNVWIVDQTGAGDFTEIQPAVIWASPGDKLVILPGNYQSFTIDGKSLTLAGNPGSQVLVQGISRVRNITASPGVHIDGLTFWDGWGSLTLEDNTSPVWMSDCTINGGGSDQWGEPATVIKTCSDIGFVRCSIGGASGDPGDSFGLFQDGFPGGAGMSSDASNLQLFECTIKGGEGGAPGDTDAIAGSGAAAIRLRDSTHAFISRTELIGGMHGDTLLGCADSFSLDGSSVVRQFQSTVTGSNCARMPAPFPEADTTALCFGSANNCPCGNNGFGAAGCRNSSGGLGGELSLSGSASVSADTITLMHSGLPVGTPLLFFQGTAQIQSGLGAPFGDGLFCAGGSIVRLGTRISSGAVDAFGFNVPGDPLLSVQGQIPASGATRYYQVWYREPNPACGAGMFNFSNALLIPWNP